jgi:hypothetical protein
VPSDWLFECIAKVDRDLSQRGGHHQTFGLPLLFASQSGLPPVGLEQNGELPGKTAVSGECGANGGAPKVNHESTPQLRGDADPELAYLQERWSSMRAPVRAAVLAVLAAVQGS